MYNGTIYTGQEEVASAVDAYYGTAFGTTESRNYTLNLQDLDLPHLDLSQLEEPFSSKEVEKVIKDMPLGQSTGAGWVHEPVLCILLEHH